MPERINLMLPGRGAVVALAVAGLTPRAGDLCVAEYNGATELGRVHGGSAVAAGAGEADRLGRVLRLADEADVVRAHVNEGLAEEALGAFRAEIARTRLSVKAVAAYFSLNRVRLLLLYCTPKTFDGRQVMATLQRRFGARVELRQIGVRDEAGLLGGLGPCGRVTCCATWLRQFRSVNVRMAKAQELSLNPGGINGGCGRLKCCLRYEYETYQEAGATLPHDGCEVVWDGGEGVVIGRDVMRGLLTVRAAGGRIVQVAAVETTSRERPDVPRDAAEVVDSQPEEEQDEDSSGEWTEPETAGNP